MLLSGHLAIIAANLLLLAQLAVISAFKPHVPQSWRGLVAISRSFNLPAGVLDDIEDDEDKAVFQRIATNYLLAKFQDCNGDDCKFVRERKEVEELLREVLPPLTAKELDDETKLVMSKMPSESPAMEEFVGAVMENTYWKQAGFFVVKELIFLDAVHSYYFRKKSLLDNDDYNELKDQLMWEGSSACTIKGDEALFISAVAAGRRGVPIISDVEYEKLKAGLKAANSWVVNRELDPLEKLGLNTFMSYLHRSL